MFGDSSQLALHPNTSMFDKQLRSLGMFWDVQRPIIGDTIFTQRATPCLPKLFSLPRRNWKAGNGGFAGTPPRLSESIHPSIHQSINQLILPCFDMLCTLSVKPVPGHTICRFSPDIFDSCVWTLHRHGR